MVWGERGEREGARGERREGEGRERGERWERGVSVRGREIAE